MANESKYFSFIKYLWNNGLRESLQNIKQIKKKFLQKMKNKIE